MQAFISCQSLRSRRNDAGTGASDRLEFADRLLHGNFQAVISTHLNTKCIHNHIVWNSVSVKDGKKYRSNAKSYITEVRRISDALCAEHHLSIICTEKSEQVVRPYVQWLAEQNGAPHGKRPFSRTWTPPLQLLSRGSSSCGFWSGRGMLSALIGSTLR